MSGEEGMADGSGTTPARTPIRDAASIVIVDDHVDPPRILVGRRSMAHVFMPGKLVFPGGRVDRSDLELAKGFALDGVAKARLLAGTRTRFDDRRAIALALAAIRETFEETGVMLGTRASFASKAPFWMDFADQSVRPDPSRLLPFARAITPPGRVRRYDTRFFLAHATSIARSVPFEERPTNEFDRVEWLTVPQILQEDLATITRHVLDELQHHLHAIERGEPVLSFPLYRARRGKLHRDLL